MVTGGNVPREFWPAVEKGFAMSMDKGSSLVISPCVTSSLVMINKSVDGLMS